MSLIGPIKKSELALLYQPQMSADGSTIACVEALLRHDHPVRGRVGAGEVLGHFNTPELLEELDWWVLERACRDALNWASLPVSVNVSATQFHKPDFAARVLALVTEVGLTPTRLELEIVEGAFINDFAAATANLEALRREGIRIALDDFGTGYSSLTYLLKIPVDKVKIDKCFVDNVEQLQSAAVIQAIVALSRALGLKVTAEGVETAEQHRFLRAAGCHYMQGYLFSMAASAYRRLSGAAAQRSEPGTGSSKLEAANPKQVAAAFLVTSLRQDGLVGQRADTIGNRNVGCSVVGVQHHGRPLRQREPAGHDDRVGRAVGNRLVGTDMEPPARQVDGAQQRAGIIAHDRMDELVERGAVRLMLEAASNFNSAPLPTKCRATFVPEKLAPPVTTSGPSLKM